jgi:mono/diheme cytochrome c family protein
MRNKTLLILALLLIGAVLAGASLAIPFHLSALPEPGPFETYVATKWKRWLVHRESHTGASQEPSATSESLANGQMIFGLQCGISHGSDGHTPTDIGRAMYPRAVDLGAAEVQHWSDPELFWIVRNGIRLSGMPAFGKQLSNKQIWDLVHYVRRLQALAQDRRNKC